MHMLFLPSGTGSADATIWMYLEKFEGDTSKHSKFPPLTLSTLANRAPQLVNMGEFELFYFDNANLMFLQSHIIIQTNCFFTHHI